jgi:hypothetical protein
MNISIVCFDGKSCKMKRIVWALPLLIGGILWVMDAFLILPFRIPVRSIQVSNDAVLVRKLPVSTSQDILSALDLKIYRYRVKTPPNVHIWIGWEGWKLGKRAPEMDLMWQTMTLADQWYDFDIQLNVQKLHLPDKPEQLYVSYSAPFFHPFTGSTMQGHKWVDAPRSRDGGTEDSLTPGWHWRVKPKGEVVLAKLTGWSNGPTMIDYQTANNVEMVLKMKFDFFTAEWLEKVRESERKSRSIRID